MTTPERGEVWLTRFPFTDLTAAKPRPALVLAAHGEDVIVLGIFSRIPPRAFPETWVYIDQGRPGFRSSGLRKASLIKAEKIAVVHRSILEKRLGSIDPNLVAEVDKALKAALHLG